MNHKTIIIIGFGFREIWRIIQIGGEVFCLLLDLRKFILRALEVLQLNKAILRINHYSLDSAIGFPNSYLLDNDLSIGKRCPTFEKLERDDNQPRSIIADYSDQSKIIQWYNQWIFVLGRKNG